MRLLIDVGNSAVKWAIVEADEAPRPEFELHRGVAAGLSDRLWTAWQRCCVNHPPSAAIGCSVAGASVVAEVDAAVRRLGSRLRWVRSQPRFSGAFTLDNGYRDSAQLGADRWHAMLGACDAALCANRAAEDGPLIVATAGTATTVDCIERDAGQFRFVGGCIAPGVRLMLESLAAGTAGLPQAQGAAVDFPDNTDDAIVSGVLDAQCGLVERMVARSLAQSGRKPSLWLAGGHAALLAARLRANGHAPMIEDNLVLRGLALRWSSTDPPIR